VLAGSKHRFMLLVPYKNSYPRPDPGLFLFLVIILHVFPLLVSLKKIVSNSLYVVIILMQKIFQKSLTASISPAQNRINMQYQ
jgi:hypothetical protein